MPQLDHLRRTAHWLDAGFRLPGTSFRFGLDPLLGLLPGAGDAVGALLGGAILTAAVRAGVSRFTLVRMAGNLALDAILGAVPLVGDLFDAGWKANLRNLTLLERHLETPGRAQRADRVAVIAVVVGLTGVVLFAAVGSVWLSVKVLQALGSLVGAAG